MLNKIKGNNNGKAVAILAGAVIGVAVTFLLFLLFAVVIYLFDLDRAYSAPLATLGLALGSFAAAYFVSRKIGRKGYLTGAIVGFVSFAAVTVISLIFSSGGLTVNTLFHFIVIVLASAIGGILGVNKTKNRRII